MRLTHWNNDSIRIVRIFIQDNTTAAAADATSCCWTKTHEPDGDLIWKHRNGRVTFIVGDVTKPRPAFVNSFDAVYDKDSFGALPMTVRPAFCHRMLEYTKDRAILYLECKVKPRHHDATTTTATTVDTMGPPYSLRYEDITHQLWRYQQVWIYRRLRSGVWLTLTNGGDATNRTHPATDGTLKESIENNRSRARHLFF